MPGPKPPPGRGPDLERKPLPRRSPVAPGYTRPGMPAWVSGGLPASGRVARVGQGKIREAVKRGRGVPAERPHARRAGGGDKPGGVGVGGGGGGRA